MRKDQSDILTNYEEHVLLQPVIESLSKITSKDRARTVRYIAMTADEIPMRKAVAVKIIEHIMRNGLIPGLISSHQGYYVTEKSGELEAYADHLQERENEIREMREAIIRQMENITWRKSKEIPNEG